MVWSHLSSHHACCQKHPLVLSSQAVNGLARCHSGEESACQCSFCKRCGFEPWVRKIPWSKKWQPTPLFLPKKSHGERKLAGYSPWGCKTLNTTERLSIYTLKQDWAICSSQLWTIFSHLYVTALFGQQNQFLLCTDGQLLFIFQDAAPETLPLEGSSQPTLFWQRLDTQYSQPLCDTVHFCS